MPEIVKTALLVFLVGGSIVYLATGRLVLVVLVGFISLLGMAYHAVTGQWR